MLAQIGSTKRSVKRALSSKKTLLNLISSIRIFSTESIVGFGAFSLGYCYNYLLYKPFVFTVFRYGIELRLHLDGFRQ